MAGEAKQSRGKALTCPLLCAALLLSAVSAQTVRHRTEKVETDAVSPEVAQAEAAIEKQDFPAAEKLLTAAVAANPKDDRAWYDLGYVYKVTTRREQAVEAYRKSVAAKPDVYESNLNLSLLLAQESSFLEAAKYMESALKLMPTSVTAETKASNWIALGEMRESFDATGSIAALRQAATLQPRDVKPHLLLARVMKGSKDVSGAEAEYKRALALDPKSQEAAAGLANLLHGANRSADEIAQIRQYLKDKPDDLPARTRLGVLLLKSGDSDSAMEEFERGLKIAPNDEALLHGVANAYAAQKKFALAEPKFADLVKAKPENAEYRYQYGVVLMQLHKFPEAQEQLIEALKRDGSIQDGYDQLALAASENKQYPLTIKVLDARAKLAPETPGTYFLRATAYDNLKAFPQAAENYHKFLEASNGQFPDNEWKAKHRLIAIEPATGKKKKS